MRFSGRLARFLYYKYERDRHAVNTNAELASGASIFFARVVPTTRSSLYPSSFENATVAKFALKPAELLASLASAFAANSQNSAKNSARSGSA